MFNTYLSQYFCLWQFIWKSKVNYKFLVVQIDDVAEVMRRIANLLPPAVLRIVYFSLFQLLKEYGIVVWGGCGVTNRSRITKIKDKDLRLLSHLPNNVPRPLTFDKLNIHRILCLFHKSVHCNDINNYICQYQQTNSSS